MMRLTRRYRFPAAHRLYRPDLSDAENRELYGKCSNPYGHGHNYVLEVSVSGPLDSHGRLVDRAWLDALVERGVLAGFRNRNLNQEVPEFARLVPTSENVARVIERRLSDAGLAPLLAGIRLHETNRNIVEE